MAETTTDSGYYPNETYSPVESKFDVQYFASPSGVMKIVQFVLGIVLIAIWTAIFLSIVVYFAWPVTIILLILHFFRVPSKVHTPVPWNKMEFYYTAVIATLYLIMSIVSFITLHILSAIFGLINTFAYAFDAVILFKEWKAWTDIGIGRGSNASPNP